MNSASALSIALAMVASIYCVCVAEAGQTPPAKPGNVVRRARAERVPNGAITIDGRLLEEDWQRAEPATDFVQQQPDEGARAMHQSEIRFVYDDNFLYVGGTLFEEEPKELVTNELKRDFNARDGDLFVVGLDTFLDKLNTYEFQTNPGCASAIRNPTTMPKRSTRIGTRCGCVDSRSRATPGFWKWPSHSSSSGFRKRGSRRGACRSSA